MPLDTQNSEGLLALPELQRLRGKRVTIIGAPGGRELLANTFKSRKARVQAVHVYRRMPPRFRRDQLALLENADVPLITLITSEEILDNLRAVLPLPLFGKLAAGELVVSSLRLALGRAAQPVRIGAHRHLAGAGRSVARGLRRARPSSLVTRASRVAFR